MRFNLFSKPAPWLLVATAFAVGACSHSSKPSTVEAGPQACPAVEISMEEAETLASHAISTAEEDSFDGHYKLDALARGLPMLKRASLQGSLSAQIAYSGHLIQAGIIDPTENPLGRDQQDVAEEGMLFHILASHRGLPVEEADQETYAVLLNPQKRFPSGFFRQNTGVGWLLQMISPEALDRARVQAHAWKDCWSA